METDSIEDHWDLRGDPVQVLTAEVPSFRLREQGLVPALAHQNPGSRVFHKELFSEVDDLADRLGFGQIDKAFQFSCPCQMQMAVVEARHYRVPCQVDPLTLEGAQQFPIRAGCLDLSV